MHSTKCKMKLFIIEIEAPWLEIKHLECEVRTKKQCWAILPNGKRKLFSCSAFTNETSAKRTQIALCLKFYHDTYIRYNISSYPYEKSRAFLIAEKLIPK